MRRSFLAPLAPALLSFLAAPAQADEVDFQTEVWPILESRCFECHGPEKRKGRLQLHERSLVFEREVKAGVVFLAGDPDASPAIQRVVLPEDDPDVMPPDGGKLTDEQIDVLRRWVAEGANWPEGEGGAHGGEEEAGDSLALAALSAEQAAAEETALAALDAAGAHAMRIAQGMVAVEVNLGLLRDRCDDAMAAHLAGLAPSLVWANLGGTAITDAALETLAGCGELRKLNLSRTAVTDAGLAQLSGLQNLAVLNLYGTGIGDAGLAHVRELPALTELYLWQTSVSEEAVAALREARPELYVNTGIELAAVNEDAEVEEEGEAEPELTPVNTTCPLSGQPIDAGQVVVVQGQAVALCCGNCKAKFEAEPEKYLARVEGFVPVDEGEGEGEGDEPESWLEPAADAAPINEECPFSCDFIDPDVKAAVEGHWVGFCTGSCRVLFLQDVERHSRLVREQLDAAHGASESTDAAEGVPGPEPQDEIVDILVEEPNATQDPILEESIVSEEEIELSVEAAISPNCPFSGDPIRADSLTSYQGHVVGFCNPGCRDKFAADPGPYLHLIAEFLPGEGESD